MIRIPILTQNEVEALPANADIREAEREKLEGLISAISPTWLERTATKTAYFRQVGQYTEEAIAGHAPPPGGLSEIWGEIKQIYMDLQSHKCAYCEQKLEDQSIVHDVEHYRPKKNVKLWLTPRRKRDTGLDFPDSKGAGYHLLPYSIFNYATACKHCNSSLKSDYFPIAETRKTDSENIDEVNEHEKPYLLFPFGTSDKDIPEELISFVGPLPALNQSVADPHKRLRAEVTIKFFNLDASGGSIREGLIVQRCKKIIEIFDTVTIINESNNPVRVAQKKKHLKLLISAENEHSNCSRAFFGLCMNDIATAEKHYEAAIEYVTSHPRQ